VGARILRPLIAAVSVFALLVTNVSAETITLVVDSPDPLPFSATDQSGSFEVYAQVTTEVGESLSAVIGQGVRVELQEANQGVRFTDAVEPMDHLYVFDGEGGFAGEIKGTHDETADGAEFLFSGSSTLIDGVGLLRVNFEVSGGTVGTFHVNIVEDTRYTNLTDDTFADLDYSTIGGTITVLPEPSTLALLLVAGLPLLIWRQRSA